MVVRIADSVDADDALLAGAVSDHQPGAGQLLLAEHMPVGERDPKSGAFDLGAVNADLRDNDGRHFGDADDCALHNFAWLLRENDSLDGYLFSSPNPEPTFATALKLSWVSEL
jgi:hypothetical protein